MSPQRAFAKPDLIAVVSLAAVAACLLVPGFSRARLAACALTDSDQLRLIIQGMGVFALANDGAYPLPGDVDTADATVAGEAESKNTTGNFLSFLIFNGQIRPETCVSPAEPDPVVTACTEYEYENPALAVDPGGAIWDPGFAGTPADAGEKHDPNMSNQSYAPLAYFGQKRTERWRSRGDAPTALISNRGPSYAGSTYPPGGTWQLAPDPFGTGSWTLLTYGEPDSWEGNVAYDDGAVLFQETPNPPRTTYTRLSGNPREVADNLFVNETDEAGGSGGPNQVGTRLNLLMRPISRIQAAGPSTTITMWFD